MRISRLAPTRASAGRRTRLATTVAVLATSFGVAVVAGGTASATGGTPTGTLSVIAGTGTAGAPTPGTATASELSGATDVAVDSSGNVYIADYYNNVVEKVTPGGTLSIIAGTGSPGAPTAGPATSSELSEPSGVAVDASGNVYIADHSNNVIEKVTPGGALSIFAGTRLSGAPTPGPATASALSGPYGVAVDANGNVYIADTSNQRIEKVTPGGTLSVIAGSGTQGTPTAGPATLSDLSGPAGVAVNAAGDVFIADFYNNRVEEVTPAGTLSIVAGNGTQAAPVPGPATSSPLDYASGVAVDASGNLYISNFFADEVAEVSGGTLSILTGTGTAGLATPGPASASAINHPYGLTVAPSKNLYIALNGGNEVVEDNIAPVFTADSPPAAQNGIAYSYTFAADGVPAPTYAVTSGSLPAGLSLNATTGVLSGTPTAVGSGTFTVTATNAEGTSSTTSITLTVTPTNSPVFTADSPTPPYDGVTYSYQFAASGTPAPTFAVASGSLPTGLTLSGAGLLSGTPSGTTAATFTVRATNAVGSATTSNITLTPSVPVAPTFTADTAPGGITHIAYSYTFTSTGNPAATYSTTGSVPPGLAINPTTGVLSGTPTTAGTYAFTVVATNLEGNVSHAESVVIAAETTPILTADNPGQATAGSAYSYTFTATGTPAPTFLVSSGTLPPGLTLNATTGVLSGTPTQPGTSTFVVTASSPAGSASSPTIHLVVAPSGGSTVAPSFTADSPGTPTAGTAYSYTFTASGSPAPTFVLASGALPPGLTLSSTGVLSGTPTQPGTSTFSIEAVNTDGVVTTSPITVTVAPSGGSTTAPVFTSGTTPPTATEGTSYSTTVTASGSPAPTYSVVSGSLPPGLTLNPTTGAITGIPAASGVYTATIAAANTKAVVPQNVTITVDGPPVLAADTPPTPVDGTPYSYTFTATGEPSATFSVVGGTLPAGLSLSSTGALSGTPTGTATTSFTIEASNGYGTTTTTVTLTNNGTVPVLAGGGSVPVGLSGDPYTYDTGSPSNGAGTVYSVGSGTLPPGLTLNPTTGAITGTPDLPGTYTLTIDATNAAGTTVGPVITIVVATPPVVGTVVGIADTRSGYLLVTAAGNVYNYGTFWHGSPHARRTKFTSIVGITTTTSGDYFIATANGNVYAYGTRWRGSPFASHVKIKASNPIVGIAASGRGYLLVTRSGHVYAYGTAKPPSPKRKLASPVVGIVAVGHGYLLALANGTVYTYAAAWHGAPNTGGRRLHSPVVGIALTAHGYLIVLANGTVYAYGTKLYGHPGHAVVGIAATANGVYRVTTVHGVTSTFRPAPPKKKKKKVTVKR